MTPRRLWTLAISFTILLGVTRVIDSRYPWLWAYAADQLRGQEAQAVGGPTHVMFVFADHFEPHDQATMDRSRGAMVWRLKAADIFGRLRPNALVSILQRRQERAQQ